MTEHVLHLDFECFSTLDLKKVGVENYVRAPGFAVTAVGWAFDDDPAFVATWPNTHLTQAVRECIAEGWTIRAWNAAFEWHVLTYHYGLDVPFEQMECTMQRSLAYGLPASLEQAGIALNLKIVKDVSARRLMLAMGKPRPNHLLAWHLDQSPKAQQMLQDLGDYCARDVEAERAIDKVVPPLHKFERMLSIADARINQKGVMIDIEAVVALADAVAIQRARINAEAHLLSGGNVTSPGTETQRLLNWLAGEGCRLPDLTKETVRAWLLDPAIQPQVRRMLELRQEAAKASASKLERMLAWSSTHDRRARNLFQFVGAGRTLRWAGRGPQVQNLPKPKGDINPQDVIDVARQSPEALGLFHVRPLDAIKSSLRACLVARDGHVLISVDLSQIEARVLAWLAGQDDVLRAFREGNDVYTLQAMKVGSSDRQLGKVLTLACGYGMGAVKFLETARDQYGLTLTQTEATTAVTDWRQGNSKIVELWYSMGAKVIASIGKPGVVIDIAKGMQVRTQGGVTQIRKPNTVKLTYHDMRLEDGELCFEGVDSTTKQWGKQRTYGGKLVENVVQSIARDVMAEGLLGAGRPLPVMTVHDEVVWEWPEATSALAAAAATMAMETVPAWATGLPLGSEIRISKRYGK